MDAFCYNDDEKDGNTTTLVHGRDFHGFPYTCKLF